MRQRLFRKPGMLLSLCAAIWLLPYLAKAQSVQVVLDKKVVLTDSLNLPSNTSAMNVLTLLPELLQRPGESFYSNYDVKVEGMSVSAASDVALLQLQIADIEKVEITESPTSSYQKNGVGGSINIVLRQHGAKTDKLWGSVGLAASSPLDISPQLLLGHRSNRFMMRGILLGELYNGNGATETITKAADAINSQTSQTDLKQRTQLARAYMQWTPSKSDVLRFNVSQTYTYSHLLSTQNHQTDGANVESRKSTQLYALINYKHSWDRSSLTCEGQYNYTPGTTDLDYPDKQLYVNEYTNHNASSKLEWQAWLLPQSKATQLQMSLGCQANGVWKSDKVGFTPTGYYEAQRMHFTPQNNTFFAQPYLSLELTAGRWKVKATGEFQHFQYNIHRLNNTYSTSKNDFTSKFIAEWHPTSHRNLRLIADRKLQRPTEEQLYPLRIYSHERMAYVEGNPYLVPTLSHEVRLDYVADRKWDNHSLMVDVSASYNNVDDIVSSIIKGGNASSDIIGLTQEYTTFANNGTNNILNGTLMALYRYKAFTIAFTGNVFHNNQRTNGIRDHYDYFNLALNPHFNLKDGWNGSVKVAYYSQVHRANSTLSDCAVTSMMVGKRWRDLFVYIYDRVPMQRRAKDVSTTNATRIQREYDMVSSLVGAGIKYTF